MGSKNEPGNGLGSIILLALAIWMGWLVAVAYHDTIRLQEYHDLVMHFKRLNP